jgi:hypothetical protein
MALERGYDPSELQIVTPKSALHIVEDSPDVPDSSFEPLDGAEDAVDVASTGVAPEEALSGQVAGMLDRANARREAGAANDAQETSKLLESTSIPNNSAESMVKPQATEKALLEVARKGGMLQPGEAQQVEVSANMESRMAALEAQLQAQAEQFKQLLEQQAQEFKKIIEQQAGQLREAQAQNAAMLKDIESLRATTGDHEVNGAATLELREATKNVDSLSKYRIHRRPSEYQSPKFGPSIEAQPTLSETPEIATSAPVSQEAIEPAVVVNEVVASSEPLTPPTSDRIIEAQFTVNDEPVSIVPEMPEELTPVEAEPQAEPVVMVNNTPEDKMRFDEAKEAAIDRDLDLVKGDLYRLVGQLPAEVAEARFGKLANPESINQQVINLIEAKKSSMGRIDTEVTEAQKQFDEFSANPTRVSDKEVEQQKNRLIQKIQGEKNASEQALRPLRDQVAQLEGQMQAINAEPDRHLSDEVADCRTKLEAARVMLETAARQAQERLQQRGVELDAVGTGQVDRTPAQVQKKRLELSANLHRAQDLANQRFTYGNDALAAKAITLQNLRTLVSELSALGNAKKPDQLKDKLRNEAATRKLTTPLADAWDTQKQVDEAQWKSDALNETAAKMVLEPQLEPLPQTLTESDLETILVHDETLGNLVTGFESVLMTSDGKERLTEAAPTSPQIAELWMQHGQELDTALQLYFEEVYDQARKSKADGAADRAKAIVTLELQAWVNAAKELVVEPAATPMETVEAAASELAQPANAEKASVLAKAEPEKTHELDISNDRYIKQLSIDFSDLQARGEGWRLIQSSQHQKVVPLAKIWAVKDQDMVHAIQERVDDLVRENGLAPDRALIQAGQELSIWIHDAKALPVEAQEHDEEGLDDARVGENAPERTSTINVVKTASTVAPAPKKKPLFGWFNRDKKNDDKAGSPRPKGDAPLHGSE